MNRFLKTTLITLVATVVILLSLWLPYAYGNPYSLYGSGNCVLFTYDCMEQFWPMTPDVPREWDAYRWEELIGQEKDGYVIQEVTDPGPGDVFIIPKSKGRPYGHVGMIVSAEWYYDIDKGYKEPVSFTIIESAMYASSSEYPLNYNECRYRQVECPADHLKALEAKFIRCVPIQKED